jgi:hypothetical protein
MAVLVLLEQGGRLGVDELTDLDLGRLDRCTGDVVDDAHALLPDREALVLRQRAEVAQHDDRRADGEHADRTEQAVADHRPTGDSGLVEAGVDVDHHVPTVLVGGPDRVSWLDDLVVAHQLLGPLDDARADQQEGTAEAGAEGEVQCRPAEKRLLGFDGEVRDAEQHEEERRREEHAGDVQLGASLELLVDVGGTPLVRLHPGVVDGLETLAREVGTDARLPVPGGGHVLRAVV